jgi:hypothetical protein
MIPSKIASTAAGTSGKVEEVEKWKKLSDGSHQEEEVGFGAGKVVLTDFRS